jgi:malate permease and related proteins
METSLVISKLLPVIVIIALGWGLKHFKFLNEEHNSFLKKLIVHVCLPAVILISFLRISITASLILFIPGIFLINLLLLAGGKFAARFIGGKYTPFLFTGFEYGMFAVAVFAAGYGQESVSYLAIIDLGHELFIWFVFVTILLAISGKKQSPGATLKSFLRSPIIIAIFLGILGNLLQLEEYLGMNPVFSGTVATLEMLMSLTAPLILISIGAGISLSREGILFAAKITALRMPIVAVLSLILGKFVIRNLLNLPFAYEAALFTLFIAPPPFIIPMFMPDEDSEEKGLINTTLTFYTLIALVLFVVYFSINPVI